MSSEWLRVMLEEIANKKADAQRGRAEETARAAEQAGAEKHAAEEKPRAGEKPRML